MPMDLASLYHIRPVSSGSSLQPNKVRTLVPKEDGTGMRAVEIGRSK